MRYTADMTAGALKVSESRVIADLLLSGAGDDEWHTAIDVDNVLQTRTHETAIRLRRLLQRRLQTMGPDLWAIIRDGSSEEAAHACLAAAVKHSPLLGDFLDLVVRDQYRLFAPALTKKMWVDYVEGCRGRDPEMPEWSSSTIERLRSSVFQSLAQAGYISDTRTLTLQAVHIARPVIAYLVNHNEHYVLRSMQVTL